MITQRTVIILIVTLALVGGSFSYGYRKGVIATNQKFEEKRIDLQEDILDLNEVLVKKNQKILALQAEKKGLINDLESKAINASGADAPGIASTGGLRRLERRWSSSPGASQ